MKTPKCPNCENTEYEEVTLQVNGDSIYKIRCKACLHETTGYSIDDCKCPWVCLTQTDLECIAQAVAKAKVFHHGSFLTTFAEAYLRAHPSYKRALNPFWINVIGEHKLDTDQYIDP